MRNISLIVFLSIIYSVVRYVAFTPEKWEQIPVFIANKGVSMAGAITLVLAILSRYRGNFEQASLYFRFTIFAILIHVPMSLVVLSPGYFPEFFTANGTKLKFFGELVFMFGALALGLMWLLAQGKLADRTRTIVGVTLIVILLGHVGSMGLCRGLNINAKHAYLPPMWLLSLVALLIGMVVSWMQVLAKSPRHEEKEE